MDWRVQKQIRYHFTDLSNKQILNQLRTPRTLKALEEALGDDIIPELNQLREAELDLGEKVTHEDIAAYFPGIKLSVDTLLDVDGPSPEIWLQTWKDKEFLNRFTSMILAGGLLGYFGAAICTWNYAPSFKALAIGEAIGIGMSILVGLKSPNFYDPESKSISLVPSCIARARGVMAHEYVHNVQHAVGFPYGNKFTFLAEGMAEAVRHEVGNDSETNDDAVRLENLSERFGSLQAAYRLLAKQLGVVVKKELISSRPVLPSRIMYAYGTAFFHIQTSAYGSRVFRNIVKRAKDQVSALTES